MNRSKPLSPALLILGIVGGFALVSAVMIRVVMPSQKIEPKARIITEGPIRYAVVYAACENFPAELETLLKQGGDPDARSDVGEPSLMLAAHNGNMFCCRLLLKYGANPNIHGSGNETPLRHAVFCHRISIVKYLLAHGADPNLGGKEGKTPMHSAQFHQFPDMIEILKKAGATH